MEKDRLLMSPAEVIARCDENTIGVVPTLGVTFNGRYEPVKAVSEALDQLQKTSDLDIPIHVDAASGGFLAPFCATDLEWDFRLPRVKSINASGHKFGLAPLGCGWIVWREKSDLPEDLIFNVNYLGGSMPTFALNFSRPGGQVVAQYYNFVRLGRDGYAKLHSSCYRTAQYLAREIAALGPFEMIFAGEPADGIPAVCWKIPEGVHPGFTLYDLADRLRMRGWQVPAYSMPAHQEDLVVQRISFEPGSAVTWPASSWATSNPNGLSGPPPTDGVCRPARRHRLQPLIRRLVPDERRVADTRRAAAAALQISAAEPALQQVPLISDDADDVQQGFLTGDHRRFAATDFGLGHLMPPSNASSQREGRHRWHWNASAPWLSFFGAAIPVAWPPSRAMQPPASSAQADRGGAPPAPASRCTCRWQSGSAP